MLPEGHRDQVHGVSTGQHSQTLPRWCPTQVIDLIEFMTNSPLEITQDQSLLNDFLEVAYSTSLSLRLGQYKDFKGNVYDAKEGNEGSPTSEMLIHHSSPLFSPRLSFQYGYVYISNMKGKQTYPQD